MKNQTGFNAAYVGEREDILNILPEESAGNVLDIGCSTGNLGKSIKEKYNSKVTGIELDPDMSQTAGKTLDKVINADIERIELKKLFPSSPFTCIIMADVLEHLVDPWKVIKSATEVLGENGIMIASIPNIAYYYTMASLLFRDRWPYKGSGLYDKAHLRCFALRNIKELFNGANMRIEKIIRKYRLKEKPSRLNILGKYAHFFVFRNYLTYQYLILARKARDT